MNLLAFDTDKGKIVVQTDRKIVETTSAIVVTNSIRVILPPILRDEADGISNILVSTFIPKILEDENDRVES